MKGEVDSEDEDFVFFGTPIEVEEKEAGPSQRKQGLGFWRDPASTKALPVWEQTPVDAEGRRRFHGAFTGGFSAGFFNTVGSAEGWQPKTFVSSRSNRQSVQQRVEDFYDEDELAESRKTTLVAKNDYDTFGSHAAEAALRDADRDRQDRDDGLDLLPRELLQPVADSVGIRLLNKLGWRQGKGIGFLDDEGTMGADNTPLCLLPPKTNTHGLGYDPFKGMEDFRRMKAERDAEKQRRPERRRRERGMAFGTGVFDEDDTLGGELDDYVVEDVEGAVPRVMDRGRFAFFEQDDGSDEEGPSGRKRARPLRLGGGEERKMILAPGMTDPSHRGPRPSFIAGFTVASTAVRPKWYPPPKVPSWFVPKHVFDDVFEPPPLPLSKAMAPKVPPPPAPSDSSLRQAIETLAPYIARNGPQFEALVAQRQGGQPAFAFLCGGEGAAYFRWRVQTLRASQMAVAGIGRRAEPLVAPEEAEGAGEAGRVGTAATAAAAAALEPPRAPEVPMGPGHRGAPVAIASIAEGDRVRLKLDLGSRFRSAGAQPTALPVAGLMTAEDLRRIAAERAGTSATAPAKEEALAEKKEEQLRSSVRTVEDWRPAPLVCKRFNVKDPYQGRSEPWEASSKMGTGYQTDFIALPETNAQAARQADQQRQNALVEEARRRAAAAVAAAQAQPPLPGPPPGPPPAAPAAAVAEGKPLGKALPAEATAGEGVGSPAAEGQPLARTADEFLESVFGGGAVEAPHPGEGDERGGASEAPPAPPEAVHSSAIHRPLDIFKAIFEASDSEDEEVGAGKGGGGGGAGAADGRGAAASAVDDRTPGVAAESVGGGKERAAAGSGPASRDGRSGLGAGDAGGSGGEGVRGNGAGAGTSGELPIPAPRGSDALHRGRDPLGGSRVDWDARQARSQDRDTRGSRHWDERGGRGERDGRGERGEGDHRGDRDHRGEREVRRGESSTSSSDSEGPATPLRGSPPRSGPSGRDADLFRIIERMEEHRRRLGKRGRSPTPPRSPSGERRKRKGRDKDKDKEKEKEKEKKRHKEKHKKKHKEKDKKRSKG